MILTACFLMVFLGFIFGFFLAKNIFDKDKLSALTKKLMDENEDLKKDNEKLHDRMEALRKYYLGVVLSLRKDKDNEIKELQRQINSFAEHNFTDLNTAMNAVNNRGLTCYT